MIQKTNAAYSEVHTYISQYRNPQTLFQMTWVDSALLPLDATNIENGYSQQKG